MEIYVHSKPLPASEELDEAVEYLHDTLRNKFEHFLPSGWSIALDGLPLLIFQCVSAIWFLALESGNVFWHEAPSEEEVRDVLTKLADQLLKM
jgi:hypothetical protein